MPNTFIDMCRYYRGEKTNPYEGKSQNIANFWEYERAWVFESSKKEPNFSEMLTDYLNSGLYNFNYNDGVPITLKALLFNRYAVTAYSLSNAVEPFKKMYQNEYLSK